VLTRFRNGVKNVPSDPRFAHDLTDLLSTVGHALFFFFAPLSFVIFFKIFVPAFLYSDPRASRITQPIQKPTIRGFCSELFFLIAAQAATVEAPCA